MLRRPKLLQDYWPPALIVATLLLCGVALLNGGPIYYPDTSAYLIDADKLAHFRAPYQVRPVFYGLFILPFHWDTIFFPAIFIQGFFIAHMIYLALRCCGCDLRPPGYVCLVIGLIVLTPVSFHVSHLLPDMFIGVLILAFFLLMFCLDRLTTAEIWYLLLLGTGATTFHLTALPIGLALCLLCFVVTILTHGRWFSSLLVLASVASAIVLSLSFSAIVFQRLTLTPRSPPHLLARILADGPGRAFLHETCPVSKFILCDYEDHITSVEDDFLWRLLPSIPPADAYRIKSEQNLLIRAIITRFPIEVARHMLLNTLRQLATFQSETQVSKLEWDSFLATDTPLARSLKGSLQGQRRLETPALDAINAVQAGIVMVSLVALTTLTRLAFRAGLYRPVLLSATIVAGLLANAFACGALGGVFARYEGRVVWLLPLTAVAGVLALLRQVQLSAIRELRPFDRGMGKNSAA